MTETELERMVVRLVGDGASYQKMIDTAVSSTAYAERQVGAAASAIEGHARSLRGFASTAVSVLTPLLGIGGALAGSFKGVELAADFEKNEVAFGVMLQSAEKGKQLMADLAEFAARTPLGMADVQAATKTLLQFGVAGDRVIPTMKMIGDVAGGDAEKVRRMALAYGQVMGVGHVQGDELNQMIEAGFNPLKEMARVRSKTSGKSEDEEMSALIKLKEQGKISAAMLTEAFRSATAEGGQFFNMMEKQSNTIGGLFSTMKDDIDAALREVGFTIVTELNLKGIMKDVSAVAQAFTRWLGGLSDGAKRGAASVAMATAAVALLTVAGMGLWAVITLITGGMNLYAVAFAGVIVAAIAGLSFLIDEMGGVAATWDYIKTQALAAWEWLAPVRAAVASFFGAVLDTARQMWTSFKSYARQAFDYLFGNSKTTWADIRAQVVDWVIYAEFALRNFGTVADVTWRGFKYYAVASLNELLAHMNLVLAGPIVVGMMAALSGNWRKLWDGMGKDNQNVVKDVLSGYKMMLSWNPQILFARFVTGDLSLKQIKDTIVDAKSAIGRYMSGEGMYSGGKADISFTENLMGVEIAKLKEMEAKWKAEFEAAKAGMNESYEEFRRKKLAEFALTDEGKKAAAAAAAEDLGKKTGEGMNKGLGKEMSKFDAALFGSAEAVGRIYEAQQKLRESSAGASGTGAGGPLGVGGNYAPRQVEPAGAGGRDSTAERVAVATEGIERNTRPNLNPPAVKIEAAGFDVV